MTPAPDPHDPQRDWDATDPTEGYAAFDPSTLTAGEAMIEAVVLAQAIQFVEIDDDGMTFVWAANSPEQLEAALNTLGWEIVRRGAVCEPIPDSPSPN